MTLIVYVKQRLGVGGFERKFLFVYVKHFELHFMYEKHFINKV